jgi:hypothetical protein
LIAKCWLRAPEARSNGGQATFDVTALGTLAKYSIALIAYAAGGLANAWLATNGSSQSMLARWLVAFAIGYLVFVLLVRLYCYANAPVQRFRERRSALDGWNLPLDWPRASGSAPQGCGGQFGGAGASGSFDAPAASPSLASGVANAPFDIPVPDDGVGIVVAIVVAIALVVLALGLGASLLYVLWQMPELLADAVAGAAVVGLASHRVEGWWGAVTRHTWKPVLVSLLSLVVTGAALHLAVPRAHTVSQVLAAVRSGEVHLAARRDDGAGARRRP